MQPESGELVKNWTLCIADEFKGPKPNVPVNETVPSNSAVVSTSIYDLVQTIYGFNQYIQHHFLSVN